jgi:hypothetical protein
MEKLISSLWVMRFMNIKNYLLWLRVSKIKGVKLNELEIDENGYFELVTLQ